MHPNDYPEFTLALAELAELFGKDLSETQLRLYCQALDDCSLPRLLYALQAAARYAKFFPLPAELREYAQECPHLYLVEACTHPGALPLPGGRTYQCDRCGVVPEEQLLKDRGIPV